jgi:hypothetical protein
MTYLLSKVALAVSFVAAWLWTYCAFAFPQGFLTPFQRPPWILIFDVTQSGCFLSNVSIFDRSGAEREGRTAEPYLAISGHLGGVTGADLRETGRSQGYLDFKVYFQLRQINLKYPERYCVWADTVRTWFPLTGESRLRSRSQNFPLARI